MGKVRPYYASGRNATTVLRRHLLAYRFDETVCQVKTDKHLFHVEDISNSIRGVVNKRLCRNDATDFNDNDRVTEDSVIRLITGFLVILHLIRHHVDDTVRGRVCPIALRGPIRDLFITGIRFLRVDRGVDVLSIFFQRRSRFVTGLAINANCRGVRLVGLRLCVRYCSRRCFPSWLSVVRCRLSVGSDSPHFSLSW